jgi:hypothetical protein
VGDLDCRHHLLAVVHRVEHGRDPNPAVAASAPPLVARDVLLVRTDEAPHLVALRALARQVDERRTLVVETNPPYGVAYCWGSNLAGELGNGTTISSATPVAVAGDLRFASISAGRGTWQPGLTCGITRDGGTYCWGYNQDGQLGTGSATGPESCPIPGSYPRHCSTGPVAVATGGLTFATVRAGVFHACGLTARGTAHCAA